MWAVTAATGAEAEGGRMTVVLRIASGLLVFLTVMGDLLDAAAVVLWGLITMATRATERPGRVG